jgi:hypothetical protein
MTSLQTSIMHSQPAAAARAAPATEYQRMWFGAACTCGHWATTP